MSSDDTVSIVIGLMAMSASVPVALFPPILALVGVAGILMGFR